MDFQNSSFLTVIPAWKYWAKITVLVSNNGRSVWICLFLFESARISSTVALKPIESLSAEACQFKRSLIVVVVVDVDAAVVLPMSRKMPPRMMVARTSAAADAVERVSLVLGLGLGRVRGYLYM